MEKDVSNIMIHFISLSFFHTLTTARMISLWKVRTFWRAIEGFRYINSRFHQVKKGFAKIILPTTDWIDLYQEICINGI